MQKDELLALAERVVRLTGHDNDTQEAVLLAFGWAVDGDGLLHRPDGSLHYGEIPAILASIDAAMTLVPGGEDGRWQAGKFNTDPTQCSASIAIQGDIPPYGCGIKIRAQATAATPALALTAAALRAIAERQSHD